MNTYRFLADIAANWMTVYFLVVFIGIVLWVFRPGSGRFYESARHIPLRHEDRPAPARDDRRPEEV